MVFYSLFIILAMLFYGWGLFGGDEGYEIGDIFWWVWRKMGAGGSQAVLAKVATSAGGAGRGGGWSGIALLKGNGPRDDGGGIVSRDACDDAIRGAHSGGGFQSGAVARGVGGVDWPKRGGEDDGV